MSAEAPSPQTVHCTLCETASAASARFCPHCAELLPLPAGEFFAGRYTIRALIGVRGIGRSYRVEDSAWKPGAPPASPGATADDRPPDAPPANLVLTELRHNRGWTTEAQAYYREQFAREVALLATLQDLPTVPRLVQDLTERGEDRLFFVSEVPSGETLQQALDKRSRPFPPDVVLDWGIRLGELLARLHSQSPPFVHADLQPDALYVGGASVRLADLNIIRRVRTDGLPHVIEDNGFAAPEAVAGRPEPRSDLYSLAATMAVLLINQPPLAPSPDVDVLHRINARVPAWLSHLIAINLSEAPYDRYAHADDVIADLRRQQVADTVACHVCGAPNRRTEIYCQECSRPLMHSTRQCDSCDHAMPVNARFCPTCGVQVS